MLISIDFGGSTTDLIVFEKGKMQQTFSFESNEIKKGDIWSVLEKAQIENKKIEKIRVTGGFGLKLPEEINGIRLEKIPEFNANGTGGMTLGKTKNCLVVSLGTGTSIVKVIKGKIEHIGGTGVGGGTLIGLGKLLLNESDFQKIDQMAEKGDLRKVDLSVGDIVGSGIGMLSENATASNFGKLAGFDKLNLTQNFNKSVTLSSVEGRDQLGKTIHFDKLSLTKSDLALGICNLIGETVGSIAYFASEKYGLEEIVLIGKVTRVKSILRIIQTTSKIYNKEIIVPKNADFGTAIGAGIIN